ncbi:hypothetical protein GQR58_006144 [Nymphon striatum]|nr:hypothetical protein GQR58_006144 [Nymphon striatum]
MTTANECICCREIVEVNNKLIEYAPPINCITDHPGFLSVCLDPYVLEAAYKAYKQNYGDMKVTNEDRQTFFNHQKHFLYPAINDMWEQQQARYISDARGSGTPIVIGGDGWADTPGHSAKYGSYSMVDLNKHLVVDIILVQSNEVSSSNAMEMEGLLRGLKWLKDNNLPLQTMVTDQHSQIIKYLREKEPGIKQYFDVWHVAKGLKKKLFKVSKEKECEKVGPWIKSITNHMYWVAASTPSGDSEEMVCKWVSVFNHMQNIHQGHSNLFPNCEHESVDADYIDVMGIMETNADVNRKRKIEEVEEEEQPILGIFIDEESMEMLRIDNARRNFEIFEKNGFQRATGRRQI